MEEKRRIKPNLIKGSTKGRKKNIMRKTKGNINVTRTAVKTTIRLRRLGVGEKKR